jgi:hypothetical protein
MAMMASGVRLSGVTSRELILGVLACPAVGSDGGAISVGISAALLCWLGFQGVCRNPGLSCNQMAVAAQYTPRLAAAREVKCRDDACEYTFAPGSGFVVGMTAHR